MTARRIAELLAAANLAPAQLAQAQQQGANDAARTGQWAGLLKALPGAATTVLDAGTRQADKDAETAAAKAVADHLGDVGTQEAGPPAPTGAVPYSDTPGQAAGKATDALGQIAKGEFDPFGIKADAYARAQAKAQGQIAANIDTNRKTAQTTQRQQNQDAVAADDRSFERSRATSKDETEAQDRARGRLPSLVSAGIANGLGPDEIAKRIKSQPGFGFISDDEVLALHQKLSNEGMEHQSALEALAKKQESDLKNDAAQRARDYAAASASKVNADTKSSKTAGTSGDAFVLTKPTISKIQQQRLKTSDVRDQAATVRRALMDPSLAQYTGPLTGVENYLTSKVGLQPQKAAQIASTLGQYFDAYKVSVTGAAATDKEMATLLQRQPNVNDTLQQAIGKLDAGDTLSGSRLAFYDSLLSSGDIRGGASAPAATANEVPPWRR